jgi:A/G-specific adenine glycosylase
LSLLTTSFLSAIARSIIKYHDGIVPSTRDQLKALPGVGEYVAGAVLSIGYGKKEWIVDSNIAILFRYYFGIKTSKEGRQNRHIIETAKIYICSKNLRIANLAILDFTALVCTPRNPKHDQCSLRKDCQYFLQEIHNKKRFTVTLDN